MEWYAAESTAEEKPKELDITSSPHLVYKRRNIEKVPMSNENEESMAGEKWVYEECMQDLSLIHISEPTRPCGTSRMPSSA